MSDPQAPHRDAASGPSGRDRHFPLAPLLLGAFAIFIGGALLTASPDDPSLLTGGSRSHAHNLFGMTGASLADLAYSLLGLPSLLLPLFLAAEAYRRLRRRPFSIAFALGGSLLFVALGPLLALFVRHPLPAPYPPGGSAGEAVLTVALPLLNRAGVLLLFGTFVLAGSALLLRHLPLSLGTLLHRNRRTEPVTDRDRPIPQEPVKAASPPTPEEVVAEEQEHLLPAVPEPRQPPPEPAPPRPTPRAGMILDIPPDATTPPLSFLDPPREEREDSTDFIRETQKTLAEFFRVYQVSGRMAGAQTGPVITLFEFSPAPGTKVNRITGLANELALTLKVPQVRIQVPVPEKSTVGIEVPNPRRSPVSFREIYESLSFRSIPSPLALAIGKTVAGEPYAADLARMPHLLVAGATGTGKSVCLNGLISSLLMKNGPENVRLLMIDPKRLEMAPYEGIPHLLGPVVTEPAVAVSRLRALVTEMLRRYDLMKDEGVKNIAEYRKVVPPEKIFPYIVVVIDELADLMLAQKKEVEPPIIRLAQMARAAGIHLVLATQRPSAQVVTGLIKTNIPTKIAFQVGSQIDSRVILDTGGAEFLLGAGDMLIKPPGSDVVRRLHGSYISEEEVGRIVAFWRRIPPPPPLPEEAKILSGGGGSGGESGGESAGENDPEEEGLYQEALAVVVRQKKASTSLIQRHLRIGYNRAARLIDRMEEEGIIGPSDGTSRPRPLLKGSPSHE
ncbi:MAG: DNA translocase FtsK [Nitrospirae bacterium]|nr:DNA translocase FtsK [Nitrospirota bacterium]